MLNSFDLFLGVKSLPEFLFTVFFLFFLSMYL